MNSIEIIKILTPKQKLISFVIVAIISAITSLGTAFLNGSDCTEISDKYNASIQNYNRLIDIVDETQKRYLDARKDMIRIQEKLLEVSYVLLDAEDIYVQSEINYPEIELSYQSTENDSTEQNMLSYSPDPIIIKESITITKIQTPDKAKTAIDSLIQITHKYDK